MELACESVSGSSHVLTLTGQQHAVVLATDSTRFVTPSPINDQDWQNTLPSLYKDRAFSCSCTPWLWRMLHEYAYRVTTVISILCP